MLSALLRTVAGLGFSSGNNLLSHGDEQTAFCLRELARPYELLGFVYERPQRIHHGSFIAFLKMRDSKLNLANEDFFWLRRAGYAYMNEISQMKQKVKYRRKTRVKICYKAFNESSKCAISRPLNT